MQHDCPGALLTLLYNCNFACTSTLCHQAQLIFSSGIRGFQIRSRDDVVLNSRAPVMTCHRNTYITRQSDAGIATERIRARCPDNSFV